MKSKNSCQGFTLLEMVFAMMVMAILLGVGFAGARYFWKGERVESSARNLQSVMMYALRMSVAEQKPYAVLLETARVRLIHAGDVVAAKNGEDVEILEQKSIPLDVEVFVRRWGKEDWIQVKFETLSFPVSGICEPVSFRLVNDGDVLEFSLHPLTAFPIKESLNIQ